MKTFKTILLSVVIVAIFVSTATATEEFGTYEDDPTKVFDASSTFYDTMKISWIRVKRTNLLSKCNEVRARYGLSPTHNMLNGCTIWVNEECIIVTDIKTTMHTIGHEFRHCFQRNWH